MRINVIRSVLCVVLDDKDECRILEAAVRDLFDDAAQGVIVVCNLGFGRVHPVDRFAKLAQMIVHQAQQRKIRQVTPRHILVEFALPFTFAIEVGKAVIEAAEVRIGSALESRIGRIRDLQVPRSGVAFEWDRIEMFAWVVTIRSIKP
jgi:hypothetical protein